MLTDDEADAVFARSPAPISTPRPTRRPSSVRRPRLDYALAQTLSRLTDTSECRCRVSPISTIPPRLNAHRHHAPHAVARATAPCCSAASCSSAAEGAEHPDVVVSAVCAHEFGHIAQYKYRHLTSSLRRRRRRSSASSCMPISLPAISPACASCRAPDFPAAVYATTQYALGDYRTDNAAHHGRRRSARRRSSRVSRRRFATAARRSEALQIGVRYVQTTERQPLLVLAAPLSAAHRSGRRSCVSFSASARRQAATLA